VAGARIRAERRRQERPISAEDAWIAACALRHTCPLITHNAGDYTHITHLIVLTEAGV
jgi:predicted nucleic acid-binding protein